MVVPGMLPDCAKLVVLENTVRPTSSDLFVPRTGLLSISSMPSDIAQLKKSDRVERTRLDVTAPLFSLTAPIRFAMSRRAIFATCRPLSGWAYVSIWRRI